VHGLETRPRLPCRELYPDSSVVRPVTQHRTDRAIPAAIIGREENPSQMPRGPGPCLRSRHDRTVVRLATAARRSVGSCLCYEVISYSLVAIAVRVVYCQAVPRPRGLFGGQCPGLPPLPSHSRRRVRVSNPVTTVVCRRKLRFFPHSRNLAVAL
jgi:hypothetical protein